MSRSALDEATACAEAANCAMRLTNSGDPGTIACGVAIMASAIVGNDPAARAMLAMTMFALATELDSDPQGARLQ
jgi:hypothetical protein